MCRHDGCCHNIQLETRAQTFMFHIHPRPIMCFGISETLTTLVVSRWRVRKHSFVRKSLFVSCVYRQDVTTSVHCRFWQEHTWTGLVKETSKKTGPDIRRDMTIEKFVGEFIVSSPEPWWLCRIWFEGSDCCLFLISSEHKKSPSPYFFLFNKSW